MFAQLLSETGMGISEGLQLRVKDLDFDHGTIIVREGKASKDRALMLPESLVPSLREQLARARAWWPKAAAAWRFLTPLSGSIRALDILGRGSGFLRSTRIRPIHAAVSCVAITCMTRPFSAPSNVPWNKQVSRSQPHRIPCATRSRRPCSAVVTTFEPCRTCSVIPTFPRQ